ncbi:unnamed protein product [Mesocestoides corti]|uniref:Uncharacterized protein n=1 Tax=Mesocestoides corti TaxID=53468 RepID=A0A0R3UC15_MESCO|nr:unnamed protein product [Mesocestoides corti]
MKETEARATRQAPSIRVHHAGHAAQYILLLSRVLLRLAAYLPCMPLELRETQNWLRPDGPICLRPDPTPLATRQATSIRVHHTGHAAHYILLLSRVLLWLTAFHSRMPLDRRETRDWLRPGGPTCLRPNPTPHHTTSYNRRPHTASCRWNVWRA